jgi:3-phosphoshikimate 1-carboxyvinyltransferase
MNLTAHPSDGLNGEVCLPGDKSLSHRAALLAALAQGESRVDNFPDSGVTRAMLDALARLGVEWTLEDGRLTVRGPGWRGWQAPRLPLDCGNSATTLRLLAGALAAAGLPAVLDGSGGLRRRPMARILQPLQEMGVPVTAAEGGCAPLHLAARPADQPLQGIEYSLPVASAQVKSCLLLAGLAARQPLTLHEPGPSRDHTERMLREMGCQVESTSTGPGRRTVVFHPPAHPLRPLEMTLPGDLSSAAFLAAAALIVPGSRVTIRQVGLNPTRTGILDAFRAMGGDLAIEQRGEQGGEPWGDISVRFSQLNGIRIAGDLVVRMIDEFPILAVTACFASGTTEVTGAAELRYKESDRISALCSQLRSLGGQVEERADGFIIHGPCRLAGPPVDPHGDHRLAMAFAVAGLASNKPLVIRQAEIIHESFPEFSTMLQSLGAHIELEADHAG